MNRLYHAKKWRSSESRSADTVHLPNKHPLQALIETAGPSDNLERRRRLPIQADDTVRRLQVIYRPLSLLQEEAAIRGAEVNGRAGYLNVRNDNADAAGAEVLLNHRAAHSTRLARKHSSGDTACAQAVRQHPQRFDMMPEDDGLCHQRVLDGKSNMIEQSFDLRHRSCRPQLGIMGSRLRQVSQKRCVIQMGRVRVAVHLDDTALL